VLAGHRLTTLTLSSAAPIAAWVVGGAVLVCPYRWGNSRLAETVRETLLPGPNIKLAAPQASNYQGEAS